MLDDVIVEAIQTHESDDASVISRDIRRDHGVFVPAVTVKKVLISRQRLLEHNTVRDKASQNLERAADTMEHITNELFDLFQEDKGLAFNQRIEAAKELRQWIKLGIDTSGLHDADSNTLFVVESDWDMTQRG